MNCKKCGYPLVAGQTICSNCDEYNEREVRVNNFQSTENYSNEINNTFNENVTSYNDVGIEKKPFPKWIIFVVIVAIILVPLAILAIVFVISTTSVSSQLSKVKYNSFISTYQMLHKQVLQKNLIKENCYCNGDCNLIYDYNEDDINFYVEDKGSYYEITYEAKEYGRYGEINLKSEDCRNIADATCDKSVITGKVYKD